MGRGEEASGFMSSKWMTIILIAVLLILAAIFIWALKSGWFYNIGKKKKSGQPLKPAMNDQFHNPDYRPMLASVDNRLRVVAELSWQKPASSSLV